MHRLKTTLLVLLAMVGIVLAAVAAVLVTAKVSTDRDQSAIQTFYTPPDPLPTEPGTVIRMEPLGIAVPNAAAFRILYVSERADGTPAASSGMIFIPEAPAPAEGRPVVAWAHGTLGMGDACVPSRSTDPLRDTANWLDQMMQFGWVVVATDYVGLGTPGPNQYLVAQSEVRDVVNSVRAARNIAEARAGSRYVSWGHSQGGHSSLWTGHLGATYAPELVLLGVAAAAPALELPSIMSQQWNTAAGWVIGPDVMESWPTVYSDLVPADVESAAGERNGARLAAECIKASGVEALARETIGQQYFSVSPLTVPSWAAAAKDQTPPPLPAQMPVFIAQGTADQVVLAWPNALAQETWCKAGSTISVLWMGGVTHNAAATTAGPSAVEWIADRFAGRPAPRTCDVPPPVAPQPGAAATGS